MQSLTITKISKGRNPYMRVYPIENAIVAGIEKSITITRAK
jgi:hypothetical protein